MVRFDQKPISTSAVSGCAWEAKLRRASRRTVVVRFQKQFALATTRDGAGTSQMFVM